ncbi:MAG: hypothetical protein V2A79_14555 [Planctomycetota bacterium]
MDNCVDCGVEVEDLFYERCPTCAQQTKYIRDLWDLYVSDGIVMRCNRRSECVACEQDAGPENYSTPVGVWYVGRLYPTACPRVLFVGKALNGWKTPEDARRSPFATMTGARPGFIQKNVIEQIILRRPHGYPYDRSPYWLRGVYRLGAGCLNLPYERRASDREEATVQRVFDSICVTNITKCGSNTGSGLATPLMRVNCIRTLKLAEKEVMILRPHVVLFMTGRDYDADLAKMHFGTEDATENLAGTDQEHDPWIWRVGEYICLRTRHPRGMSESHATCVLEKLHEVLGSGKMRGD